MCDAISAYHLPLIVKSLSGQYISREALYCHLPGLLRDNYGLLGLSGVLPYSTSKALRYLWTSNGEVFLPILQKVHTWQCVIVLCLFVLCLCYFLKTYTHNIMCVEILIWSNQKDFGHAGTLLCACMCVHKFMCIWVRVRACLFFSKFACIYKIWHNKKN